MPTAHEKRLHFRQLHERGFFLLPNAWDPGSAKRLAALGFRALASTSAGAAWALGRDDGGLTLDETVAHLSQLVASTDLPVNADFEAGFADAPEGVAANVARAAATGIAALSIEDWSGSARYDRTLAAERIATARAALDAVDPAMMLVGRSEHFRVPGTSAAESIARAVDYARAGADCLFVPFMDDRGAIAELVAAVAPKPVNLLVGRFDDTIVELAEIGVRRCSVGASLAKVALDAVRSAAEPLISIEQRAQNIAAREGSPSRAG